MNQALSTKERQLLEDQKNHEEICIKKYSDYAQLAKDPKLSQLFETHAAKEKEHLDTINQLLNGQVPNPSGMQGGGSSGGMQSGGSSGGMQSGGSAGGMSGSFVGQAGSDSSAKSDKDLCTDILMTEKFVSSAYNTAIFEFQSPATRDVLNHIQKEEQKHGEAVFQYMQSNGMYQVQ